MITAALTQHGLLEWTLTILLVITLIGLFIFLATSFGSWATPRLERLQKGLKAQPGEKPCCPPGIGCNDPSKAFQSCRRERAIAAADLDELHLMEQAWAAFNATTKRQTKKRRKLLAEYGSIRDRIIYRQLADHVANQGSNHQALPVGDQLKAEEEEVDGEVVNQNKY